MAKYKTAVFREFGEADKVLEIVEQDIPSPGDDSVVVKIKYAAVNPVDNLVIQGVLKDLWSCPLPFNPGYDFSGTVHAVGKNVNELKEGDDVWAVNWGSERGQHSDDNDNTIGSAIAEYIELLASKVPSQPEGVSRTLAAVVALVGTIVY